MLVADALSTEFLIGKTVCVAAEPQVHCHQKLIKLRDMPSHLQQYCLTS